MTFHKPKTLPGLCLPDATGWRLWSFPDGEHPAATPLSLDRMAEIPRGIRIGLPARYVVAVPLWLQTADPLVCRSMAAVQLERRGLLRDGLEAWDCLLIHREETRSLATAFLIDASLPSALQTVRADSYDVAARCHPLPENAFLLWRELGGLAVAATRNRRLAFLHFLPETADVREVGGDLAALRRTLAWEGVVDPGAECIAWGEFESDELSALTSAFGTPARQETPPPPSPPEPPLSLVPPDVAAGKRRHEQARQHRSLFFYSAIAYALLLLSAFASLGWQEWQIRRLAATASIDGPIVDRLSMAGASWRAVAPAIDSSYYPLECLLACVRALPPEVRLTDFEHSPGKMLILGEGKDASSIFHFLETAKADPLLKKWTWVMPQPQLLPNNRAQFHLEGTREPAPQ